MKNLLRKMLDYTYKMDRDQYSDYSYYRRHYMRRTEDEKYSSSAKVVFFIMVISLIMLVATAVNAQSIEHIDVSTKSVFGRSEMVLYNSDTHYNDLEYLYIGRFNDNYHWVKYTNAYKIVLQMNDNEGDRREVCIKNGTENKADTCMVLDGYGTIYEYKPEGRIFQIWISKPNIPFD